MELSMPHINAINPRRAAFEQHLSKSTRRRTDIEAYTAIGRKRKPVQRRRQLYAAARNIRMRGACT